MQAGVASRTRDATVKFLVQPLAVISNRDDALWSIVGWEFTMRSTA
jgi:hypothetical protein